MTVPKEISDHNFFAFLWHATFLAFAQSFMDVDTIIPAMVIDSGGKAMHIGAITTIMMGGSSFTQLFFAPYISNKHYKKKALLAGINIRVCSLFALAFLLFFSGGAQKGWTLGLIFLFITLFAVGGAFTNVSYVDIFGKSVNEDKRKTFFSAKQIIAGSIVVVSAFLAKKTLTLSGYPLNYAYLFLIGGALLLTASGGFWKIREIAPSTFLIRGWKDYMVILKNELRQNKKLSWFLGFINTQGIIISFLPFVMLYANETFHIQSSDTGTFLLFKVLGAVSIGVFVFFMARRIKYNPLLYLNASLSVGLIVMTLFVKDGIALRYVFILGGVIFSLYSITMNGLLLEVSGKENRALYTGLAGAGNIAPTIFPLAGGWLINQFGFQTFFILFIFILLTTFFFIRKINCTK